jgi:hypothetical protein
VEMTDWGKRSSLLRYGNNYGRKKFRSLPTIRTSSRQAYSRIGLKWLTIANTLAYHNVTFKIFIENVHRRKQQEV